MSYLRYSFVFLIIAPALIQACNFTKIESTNSTTKFNIAVYDGGITTKTWMNKPPNTTTLPKVLKLDQAFKPGVVSRMVLLYPDGLNYTFNMYTTENTFYVAYSYIQIYNGKLTTGCRKAKLSYKTKGYSPSIVYYERGTSHSKTSHTLMFEITKKSASSSSAVSQTIASYLTAFVTASIVVFMNFNKV